MNKNIVNNCSYDPTEPLFFETEVFDQVEYSAVIQLDRRTPYFKDQEKELIALYCRQVFEAIISDETKVEVASIPIKLLVEIPVTFDIPASFVDYLKQDICGFLQGFYFYSTNENRLSWWNILAPFWQKLLTPKHKSIKQIASKNIEQTVTQTYIPKVKIRLWTEIPHDLENRLCLHLLERGVSLDDSQLNVCKAKIEKLEQKINWLKMEHGNNENI